MEAFVNQLGSLDVSAAALFLVVGLVFGLFGWRIVRLIVVLDAIAVAAVFAYWIQTNDGQAVAPLPAMPSAVLMLLCLPALAWRFPRAGAVGMAGLAGFVSVQLLLLRSELPTLVLLTLSILGAGLIMAMALTMARQTNVIVTGAHGGWLCIGAMAILAMNGGNMVGQMLSSFVASFSLITPIGAVAFSAILIFLQWSDMQSQTSES